MNPHVPLIRFRFGLRTLLVAVPVAAGLCAWTAHRPLEVVDAWIVVNQRDLSRGNLAATPANRQHGQQAAHELALKSPRLIAEALERPEIAALPMVKACPCPAAWIRAELEIEFHRQSELVRISLAGRDPEQLTKVLHSIAATYSRRHQ